MPSKLSSLPKAGLSGALFMASLPLSAILHYCSVLMTLHVLSEEVTLTLLTCFADIELRQSLGESASVLAAGGSQDVVYSIASAGPSRSDEVFICHLDISHI